MKYRIMYKAENPFMSFGWVFQNQSSGGAKGFENLEDAKNEVSKLVSEGRNPSSIRIVEVHSFEVDIR